MFFALFSEASDHLSFLSVFLFFSRARLSLSSLSLFLYLARSLRSLRSPFFKTCAACYALALRTKLF